MKRPKLIAIIIATILVAVVVLQNTEQVDTHILFITIAMPRAILLSITFALGLLAGLLLAWSRRPDKKARIIDAETQTDDTD